MELIEAATQMPSQEVIDRLKDKPIDKSQLPLLVDGKSLIYGTFAITFHLCKAAKRTDLFGANYHQQVLPRLHRFRSLIYCRNSWRTR